MKLSFVVAFLLCAQLIRAQRPTVMAPYSVIRTGDGYEERAYPAAKWVCQSQVREAASGHNESDTFVALFGYIYGDNEAELEIPMTMPITIKKTPVAGKVNVQVCFYIHTAHQANPPAPTNAKLYIEERPAFTAFVSSTVPLERPGTFSGFVNNGRIWEEAAEALKVDLEAAQEDGVDFSFFYRAGCNSPNKLKNRRNEVWFLKN